MCGDGWFPKDGHICIIIYRHGAVADLGGSKGSMELPFGFSFNRKFIEV